MSWLWNEPTDGEEDILETFFKNLEKGMNMAEAIRAAQIDYLGSSEGFFAHPVYWARYRCQE